MGGVIFTINYRWSIIESMKVSYPATIERQKPGGFLVQFIDLPDTFTEGDTKEEALFNAAEVLSAMLAWRLDEGREIPAPTPNLVGVHYIPPVFTL